MVGLGAAHGVRTTALLTQMDVPLGRTRRQRPRGGRVGRGAGRRRPARRRRAHARPGPRDARPGRAGRRRPGRPSSPTAAPWTCGGAWCGPRAATRRAAAPRPRGRGRRRRPATGTLARLDAMAVGVAAWRLGAGRARKEDDVSPTAGVVWRATVGDHVEAGRSPSSSSTSTTPPASRPRSSRPRRTPSRSARTPSPHPRSSSAAST